MQQVSEEKFMNSGNELLTIRILFSHLDVCFCEYITDGKTFYLF